MLNKNINFRNFKTNLNTNYVKKKFKILLKEDNQILKSYTFKDAWPQSVSAIDLSYAAEDIARFTVTWQYQYWVSNTTDGDFNPVSALVQTG